MKKAVIFDFDDTLVQTHVVKWAHHKTVAKKFYNIDLTDDDIKPHWGKPFDEMISHLYQNADTVENMRAANRSSNDQFLKEVHEGAVEVVNELLDKGVAIGVLTATNKEFVIKDLERLGFPYHRFFMIQAADETPVHKPDPDVFIPALEKLRQLGITKKETVYVGDAVRDLLAARGAGIDFIGITSGITSKEEFEEADAKKIIYKIKQLSDFL